MKMVEVVPKLETIMLDPAEITMGIGQVVPLNVGCQPEGARCGNFFWKSSDETVAAVISEDGVAYIKAIGIGEASIICSSEDTPVNAACKVTIRSMMYSNQKSKPWVVPLILVLAFVVFVMKPFGGKGNDKNDVAASSIASVDYTEKYKDAEPIDVFEELEVTISGHDGVANLVMANTSRNPLVAGCTFSASKTAEIRNGDEIEITVIFDESEIELYGYAPIATKKTIVVSGLGSLVENYTQVTQEFLNAAAEHCKEKINANLDEVDAIMYSTHTEPEFIAAFFMYAEIGNNNRLVLVFTYEQSKSGPFYLPVYYNNLEVDGSGVICSSVEACTPFSWLDSYSDYDAMVDSFYTDDLYRTIELKME